MNSSNQKRPLESITRIAPGKLNLFLEVTGRRNDGYHLLHTVFLPLSTPADVVKITNAEHFSLTCDDPQIPRNSDNLAGKAALAFANTAELLPNWHIELTKRIPVAAGMGGGSTDAAAVLLALNEMHPDSGVRLKLMALSLGADVPYFLNPVLREAGGVGEVTLNEFPDLPKLPWFIMAPEFPVSAAWSYRALNLAPGEMIPETRTPEKLLEFWHNGDISGVGRELYNRLGWAVMAKFPLLQLLRRRTLELGACGCEVSGSGPTLFALARDFESRDVLINQLKLDFPACRIEKAESL